MRTTSWFRRFALLLVVLFCPHQTLFAEDPRQDDAQMNWWREARFGMFVHWGLYSVAAGEFQGRPVRGISSWTLHETKAPLEQYTPLLQKFNPERFNAEQLVGLAKAAGMKYLVITTKHHEGFCLFDSKHTDFDVTSTPFKRDIMKELAEACRRQGIKLGWYHSILDWHHPDYLPRRPGDERPTSDADFERYVAYMKSQLQELLTNYGPIDVLWFDGEWDSTWNRQRGWDLYDYVRGLRPEILINNRVGGGRQGMAGMTKDDYAGDFGTPEQEIPPAGLPGVDWESCMTMNNTWGYKRQDQNWKSTETLVHMLVDCASKGGNFLLNVGPQPDGTVPQASVERLEAMGRWIRIHGESIYGTGPSPFARPLPWGRCTSKPLPDGNTRLYLHVFDWPADGHILVPRIQNRVLSARLWTDPDRPVLSTKRQDRAIRIKLPAAAPDPYDSVIVLDIEGAPRIVPFRAFPGPDGRLILHARDARIHGLKARYDGQPGRESIGYWTELDEWVSWPIHLQKPGKYQVAVSYGCEDGHGGGEYIVEVAGRKLPAKAKETGGWFERVSQQIGTFELTETGDLTVSIRLTAKPGLAVMDLQAVEVCPVAPNR